VENPAGIKPQRTRRTKRITFKENLLGPFVNFVSFVVKNVLALKIEKFLFSA
jgi:hypothetical protein